MRKITAMSLAAFLSATLFVGCNSESEYVSEDASSNVAASAFAFQADKKVMVGLDSVFFSIDLENARIFNATPLPYGTSTKKLVADIQFVDIVQSVKLTVTRDNLPDTVYNYGENPTDSIDYTYPVKMEVVSYSGLTTRTYTITVNVSKEKSDSLSWDRTARRELPTTLSAPTAQKTVATSDGYYCLVRNNDNMTLSNAANPAGTWNTSDVNYKRVQMESFTAAGDKFYMILGNTLQTSADANDWTITDRRAEAILGAYGDKVLYVAKNDDKYVVKEYPGDNEYEVPTGMPVFNTSQLLPLDFAMADSKQVIMMGGTTADGLTTSDVWGFDGKRWACITVNGIGKNLRDITLVPYYTFRTPNINTTYQYVCLLALGGTDGKDINRTVYTSVNYGMTWTEGGDLVQLPLYIPSFYGAQAFVVDQTLTESRSNIWLEYMASRATEPITDWQCPYIYLFGGYTADGSLSPYIWRGVINRFTVKPIQ